MSKEPTEHSFIEQLASELNSISVHLVRRLRDADRSLGITPARLSALSVLVFGGPMSLNDLARAEQVTGPTMSRIVAALEDERLVRREPDPHDRRAIRLSPTPRGRRIMERGRQQRVERLSMELSSLTPADRQVLSRAVGVLASLGH